MSFDRSFDPPSDSPVDPSLDPPFDLSRVRISHLEAADLDEVVRIADSLEDAPHWPRQFYEEALSAHPPRRRIALAARLQEQTPVVGFAIASLIAPEADLESIAVDSRLQHLGIGRRLLRAVVEELRAAGIRELLLEVRSSNAAAIRFYEAQNFKKTGVRRSYYADPQEDAVLYVLSLA